MLTEIEKYFNNCINIFNRRSGLNNHSVFYRIGSGIFKINYISSDLEKYFGKAINHLRTNIQGIYDIDIYVMDKISINRNLPKPVWDWSTINIKGDIDAWKPRFHINYEDWGIFSIYDSILKIALLWAGDINEIPYWHRSFPFKTIINWYFYPTDFQPVHSAAVGYQDGCVILAGRGGSGKSCTALSCLNSDLKYLGDDFVLVKINENQPEVFSLYNVAKLEKKDINRFPDLKFPEVFHGRDDNQKLQIFVNEIYPEKMLLFAPLKAILVPIISNSAETTITSISKHKAMKALIPSTINLLKGEEIRPFKKMSDLIKKMPCFAINLGYDQDLIPGKIQNFLNNYSA